MDLTVMHPEAPGALCIGHPLMCNVFHDAAVAGGVRFIRGVENIGVTPGTRPSVSFVHDGHDDAVAPPYHRSRRAQLASQDAASVSPRSRSAA